jgi:hypothetical protein
MNPNKMKAFAVLSISFPISKGPEMEVVWALRKHDDLLPCISKLITCFTFVP